MISTCIITGYGINADYELAEAFRLSGSQTKMVHINDLIKSPELLANYEIAAVPGGFSFGDHIGSGLVFSRLIKKHLKQAFKDFTAAGKLIIGICNGFQVLVKAGILPDLEDNWKQEVSLIHNDSGLFEDSWVRVTFNPESSCIWTSGLDEMDLPIRHGEGRFIAVSNSIRDAICREKLDAITYKGRNPNGSDLNIAGITDRTGRILGLMPHPEAFMYPENHPKWTRKQISDGAGLKIFRNGVAFAELNLQK